MRSAGACADEPIASRASRQGEAGDHLARQPLRFRDDLLVVRPFADQRVAIESVLQQPEPVRGAAQIGNVGAGGGARRGLLLLSGEAPKYRGVFGLASLIEGVRERRMRDCGFAIPALRRRGAARRGFAEYRRRPVVGRERRGVDDGATAPHA